MLWLYVTRREMGFYAFRTHCSHELPPLKKGKESEGKDSIERQASGWERDGRKGRHSDCDAREDMKENRYTRRARQRTCDHERSMPSSRNEVRQVPKFVQGRSSAHEKGVFVCAACANDFGISKTGDRRV